MYLYIVYHTAQCNDPSFIALFRAVATSVTVLVILATVLYLCVMIVFSTIQYQLYELRFHQIATVYEVLCVYHSGKLAGNILCNGIYTCVHVKQVHCRSTVTCIAGLLLYCILILVTEWLLVQ